MRFKLTNLIGAYGEQLALAEYLRAGYRLIAQNVYNPHGKRLGEIDIIVQKGGVIVFVEVKTRLSLSARPEESVTFQKRQKLIRAVEWFLYHNQQYLNYQPRIDVCAVCLSSVDKPAKSVKILPNAVTLDY
jgi:putative endonuclease